MTDTASFTAADGTEIAYRHWPAEGAPRASVVVVHGLSEHSGRYARFAAALTASGYEVFALDHRGHGLTSQATGVGTLGTAGFAGVADDVHQLVGLAGRSARPVLLFGHSLGTVIGLRYAELHPGDVAALAFTGPLGVIAGGEEMLAQLRGAVQAGLADQPMDGALAAFNAPFEPARTPFDWLSRDEAEVDTYVADPYCGAEHPPTYGYMAEMIGAALDGVANVEALPPTLPVLLAAGERDSASGATAGVRELAGRLRAAGLTEVQESYYPDARHEILNELNRDEVTADVIDWLDRVVAQTA